MDTFFYSISKFKASKVLKTVLSNSKISHGGEGVRKSPKECHVFLDGLLLSLKQTFFDKLQNPPQVQQPLLWLIHQVSFKFYKNILLFIYFLLHAHWKLLKTITLYHIILTFFLSTSNRTKGSTNILLIYYRTCRNTKRADKIGKLL